MTSDTPRKGLPSAWHNAGLSFLSAFANLVSSVCSTSLMQSGTRNRSDPLARLSAHLFCLQGQMGTSRQGLQWGTCELRGQHQSLLRVSF